MITVISDEKKLFHDVVGLGTSTLVKGNNGVKGYLLPTPMS